MKPIETQWKGWRFRSRLEARWAVFFESLGIEFLYEPEPFELPDGTVYLPDFYLPVIRFFAEVKPAEFTPEEIYKAEELTRGTGRQLLMLVGQPDYRPYEAITVDSDFFTRCEYSLDVYSESYYYSTEERRLFSQPEEITENDCSDRYRQAIEASRGERFGS